MSDFNALETAVMQKLLDGDSPLFESLREQFRVATVKSRELTGVGFFVDFALPPGVEPIKIGEPRLVFGDVEATIPGLQLGAGFVLFVEHGLLQMLEGHTYGEPWPDDTTGFELRYSDPTREEVLALVRDRSQAGR